MQDINSNNSKRKTQNSKPQLKSKNFNYLAIIYWLLDIKFIDSGLMNNIQYNYIMFNV